MLTLQELIRLSTPLDSFKSSQRPDFRHFMAHVSRVRVPTRHAEQRSHRPFHTLDLPSARRKNDDLSKNQINYPLVNMENHRKTIRKMMVECDFDGIYPLVITNMAMENHHRNS